MAQQIPVQPAVRAEEVVAQGVHEVLADVAYKRLAIVNCVFVGLPYPETEWVLVDAGVSGTGGTIARSARQRFGRSSAPAAIVLTHAHFDHIGAIEPLLNRWNVPVYAHELELPYLNGSSSYPPPDPSVGGGMMAATSLIFPRGPIDISEHLQALPADGSIPNMPGWRWIHTPGHSPGHVSLWRESDRTLIVGDAFIATAQESAYAALTQELELHGPPMYYTIDWKEAEESVKRLAALEPELVITGHGRAMKGAEMRDALRLLAERFEEIAVPEEGQYVLNPAEVEDGSAYIARD